MSTKRDIFLKWCVLPLLLLNLIGESSTKPMTTSNEIDNSENPTDNEIADALGGYLREEYARKMLTYMNQSVDPCEDFYEYACGNWPNIIQKHDTEHKRSNLLDIVFKLNDIVEGFLNKSAQELDIDYVAEWELTQQFYESCLKADLMPMQRSQVYLDVIRSIGGFPAVESASWNATNFSWFNMTAHLTNYGVHTFINDNILPQYPFLPYFEMPELGFDLNIHSDNIATNNSNGYKLNEKRMVEYLTTYGVDPASINRTVGEIFDFWRAILNVTDGFNEDLELCSFEESENFTQFSNYLDIAWPGKNISVTDVPCPCDYFYLELDKICNEHRTAAANYLALKFLYNMDARLEDQMFQKEYCIMTTQSTLPYLIDNVYLKEQFNDGIRDEINTIVEEVRKSLRNLLLEETIWLDEATRKEALLKESTIKVRIGYLDEPALKDRLIREMNSLTFAADNFAENNIKAKKFKTFMTRYLGLHYEEMDNNTKPLELMVAKQVNAFYYNVDNSINIMAGVLLPPAYHQSWPNSLKFGTLGYLVGHEFTHGFDSIGGNYDSNGEARSWYTNKSEAVFNERANCYVDHFSKYKIPHINRYINGNITKDENIADSGGLREALSAYRRFIKHKYKEIGNKAMLQSEQIPGLNLSPDQLFFLGFGQLWCAALKEEHYWQLLTDEHTVDKFRVLGAVTNDSEFAKVYNCPIGSKMNPAADKCRIW